VRDGAFEQRTANASATVRREDREPDFGEIVNACHMRHANEREPIVVKAKNCIAVKVNSVDVGGNGRWRKRNAESRGPVYHGQRKKMRHERGAYTLIQTLDGESHHRASG
jgi:hypothetical protein